MNAHSTKWLLVISLFNLLQENNGQRLPISRDRDRYVPATPVVEPLSPKGLRMSIPDEEGISLVAFHVKFNEDFNGLEAGDIARDIVKVRNGRWTYEDRTTRLRKGDVIYYWIYVIRDGLGYNLIDKQHIVNEFYNYDGTPMQEATVPPSTVSCTSVSETRVFDINENNKQLKRYNVCPGQLIFEENFDSLNITRWTIVERFSGAPSYEFVVYMNSQDAIQVKNGALHIKPVLTDIKYGEGFVKTGSLILDRCTGEVGTTECKRSAIGSHILPPVITGRLNTKNSFAFLYGHVQVRAKLPRGDWIYPMITLESIENRTEASATYCDIIIAHSVGNPVLTTSEGQDISGRVLLAGAHAVNLTQTAHHDNHGHLPLTTSNSLWSDDYHVYDLAWTSGRLVVTVDGISYGEQRIPALYDTPVYINVGLAVGGHSFFPDQSRSGTYIKPWRNIASKALYNFYRAEANWLETWQQSDTGLHIDYIKVLPVLIMLMSRTDKCILAAEPVSIFSFIHDLIQYNVAGIPLIHEHTQWNFDPEVGKQRRVRYEEENGRHGEIAIAKIGMGIGYNGPWGTSV